MRRAWEVIGGSRGLRRTSPKTGRKKKHTPCVLMTLTLSFTPLTAPIPGKNRASLPHNHQTPLARSLDASNCLQLHTLAEKHKKPSPETLRELCNQSTYISVALFWRRSPQLGVEIGHVGELLLRTRGKIASHSAHSKAPTMQLHTW